MLPHSSNLLAVFLFMQLLVPQVLLADCYERFYHKEHLEKKGPQQEIISASLSTGYKYFSHPETFSTAQWNFLGPNQKGYIDTDEEMAHLTLRVFDYSEGRHRSLQVVAKCQGLNDESAATCNAMPPARGKFIVGKQRGEDKNTTYFDRLVTFETPNQMVFLNSKMQASDYQLVSDDDAFGVKQSSIGGLWAESGCMQADNLVVYEDSVVRAWNEVILESVRRDLARPTVTARNLFHHSVLMWNVHACLSGQRTYGDSVGDVSCPDQPLVGEAYKKAFHEAASYASYVFLRKRYALAPGNTGDRFPTVEDEEGDFVADQLVFRLLHRTMWNLGYANSNDEILATLKEESAYRSSGLDDWVLQEVPGIKEMPSFETSVPVDHFVSKSPYARLGTALAKATLAYYQYDGSLEKDNYYNPDDAPQLVNYESNGVRLHLDYVQSGVQTPLRVIKNDENNARLIWGQTQSIAGLYDVDHWLSLSVPDARGQNANVVKDEQEPLSLYWGSINKTFGDLSKYKASNKPGVYFDPVASLPKFKNGGAEADLFIKENLDAVFASAYLNPLNQKSMLAVASDDAPEEFLGRNPGASFIDISPANYGNYVLGTNRPVGKQPGRSVNPKTGQPYDPVMVKRATFYRSLAEFWADGPNSETPPGHWNTLANYVLDEMPKKGLDYKWNGQGDVLGHDEYSLMLYLSLNGALHNAAVVAWGIKGHYQGSRPITVIRRLAAMAEEDEAFAEKLVTMSGGFLKMVEFESEIMSTPQELMQQYWQQQEGGRPDGVPENAMPYDSVYQFSPYLYDQDYEEYELVRTKPKTSIRKLAVWAWRGHSDFGYGLGEFFRKDFRNLSFRKYVERSVNQFFSQPFRELGGTGWILAENWMPYQKTNFVTPPFPGFVSGHSTFSRAAAEVLSYVTGSSFFPGGLGQYKAPRFHFEAVDYYEDLAETRGEGAELNLKAAFDPGFTFQWATYCDAADQSGISRIYGGIHASFDDLPARKIGAKIGLLANQEASRFFGKEVFNAEERIQQEDSSLMTLCQ